MRNLDSQGQFASPEGQQWWVAGHTEPVADGQYEIVGERICERSYEGATTVVVLVRHAEVAP